MKHVFASLACALLLTACMSSQNTTVQTVEYGCASASAALKIVNANFARLNAATIAAVSQAKAVTDPICLQPTVPTLTTTAQAAFTGAVATLANAAK